MHLIGKIKRQQNITHFTYLQNSLDINNYVDLKTCTFREIEYVYIYFFRNQ